MDLLRRRCAPFAADGHLELFKSTKRYDGALGREQHGYPPSAELPLWEHTCRTPSKARESTAARRRGSAVVETILGVDTTT
jgi:hypothetical protein